MSRKLTNKEIAKEVEMIVSCIESKGEEVVDESDLLTLKSAIKILKEQEDE